MALLCAIAGVLSFLLLKTRLPPKPPGDFFYPEAFRSIQYNCVVLNFVVSPFLTNLYDGKKEEIIERGKYRKEEGRWKMYRVKADGVVLRFRILCFLNFYRNIWTISRLRNLSSIFTVSIFYKVLLFTNLLCSLLLHPNPRESR